VLLEYACGSVHKLCLEDSENISKLSAAIKNAKQASEVSA